MYTRGTASRSNESYNNPDPPMHFDQPEEQYTTYSRNDFNSSRNFNPIFEEGRRTNSHRARTAPTNPQYTYHSGRLDDGPSAPHMEDVGHLSPEELRQQRLRRFE